MQKLSFAVNEKVTKHLNEKNWSSVSVTFCVYGQEVSNCMKLLMFVVDFLLLNCSYQNPVLTAAIMNRRLLKLPSHYCLLHCSTDYSMMC